MSADGRAASRSIPSNYIRLKHALASSPPFPASCSRPGHSEGAQAGPARGQDQLRQGPRVERGRLAILSAVRREANYKQFKKIREEKGTKKTRRMTAIQAAWRLCWGAGAFQSLLACQIMVKFPPGSRIYKHAKSILQSGAQQLRSSQERNRTQIAEVKPC